jgi:hypothetical protein
MNEWMRLGMVAELGQTRVPVEFDLSSEHVVAVVGKRGSGKSFTLGVLVEGLSLTELDTDIASLYPSHAVLLLDSLNIYWPSIHPVPMDAESGPLHEQAELLRKWKLSPHTINAQLWAPAGFGPAYLDTQPKLFRFSVGSFSGEDWGDLFGIDVVRDPMGQAVSEAQRKVTASGWRLHDTGERVPAQPSPSLDDLVECLERDGEIQSHFAQETIRASIQRFRSLSPYGVFARDGTDLTELLVAGSTAILLVGAVPDAIRSVFVSVLARRLLAERAEMSGVAKRATLLGASADEVSAGIPPTWLLIDEAQNFLPAGRTTAATQSLIRYVREGRNYGLSFVVTSQQPAAIDARIMAQVDTLIAHQLVTARDASVVVENLKCPAPRSISFGGQRAKLSDSLAQLEVGQAALAAPDLPRTVFVSIRPRLTMHGGFEA